MMSPNYLLQKSVSCILEVLVGGKINGKVVRQAGSFLNPIPNRLGHVTYNERADSALTW